MGVTVRHNARLAALVALAASVVTVAWFSRALQTESPADWAWCVLVAAVGVLQLVVIRDARAPLMVADEHGVRVRRGETWSGLRWQDIAHVEVQSPKSRLRDGHIVVHPRLAREVVVLGDGEEPATGGIHEGGTSTPGDGVYVVPLARTTRLRYDGMTGDLIADLDSLASGRVPVLVATKLEEPVETEDAAEVEQHDEQSADRSAEDVPSSEEPLDDADEEEAPARGWADRFGLARRKAARIIVDPTGTHPDEESGSTTAEPDAEPDEVAAPEFLPLPPARETRPAARTEVVRETVQRMPVPTTVPAQRDGGNPVLVSRVDEFAAAEPRPARNPLIGPLIAAARNRARLSIDVLSERTRIRPHVLECIEVDDFEACGGDFYARGHLRTLARVFGLDAEQLLDLYDDNYASAEIEARQVFEAELATGIGGGVRATHSGPRWTLLAACVLALASVWGAARVFNDTPQELVSPAPNVVDSAGLAGSGEPSKEPKSTLAPLEVAAEVVSPQVVVRDRDGRILWAGKLGIDQRQQVIGLAPFEVTSSNGAAVKVWYLGKPKGAVGETAEAASRQFG